MAEKTLTHKDLAKALKVSETTIKSYRRKFTDCIPVASKGKPIRFTKDALAVCLRIRDLFETGMSVEEVRGRLAQEFTWIALVAAKPEPAGQPVALPQEFTLSLSNLAKSMVTLTQQQNAIIGRLQALEGGSVRAAASGVAGAAGENAAGAIGIAGLTDELRELVRQELAPLRCLDEVRDLVASIRQAADKMAQAAQALRDVAARPSSVLSALSAQEGAENSAGSSRVIPFPSAAGATGAAAGTQGGTSGGAVASGAASDPSRNFLLMPLVVRTAGGAYISAGGKASGRFTLNDLKALLAYGKRPPEHYTLHWEQNGSEWRLALEQPASENPRPWLLLLKEAVSQRGISVAEIVQLSDAGQNVHPAEFCAFVASLSGS